ncbi:MAG: TfoX/Sxy family protein [Oscillospiraceae bacterium]
MATSKDFLNYVLEQLAGLDEITYRMMMGEYIIYYKGKIAAELCDNRFLVKPVDAAVKYIPNAVYEPPYEGAKPMILVENLDDREYLTGLFEAIYPELPAPKPKKKKREQEETK